MKKGARKRFYIVLSLVFFFALILIVLLFFNQGSTGFAVASNSIASNQYSLLDSPSISCNDSGMDADGDGYTACNDCDDSNPSIHPNATETECNGVDEDCNGFDYCPSAIFNTAYWGKTNAVSGEVVGANVDTSIAQEISFDVYKSNNDECNSNKQPVISTNSPELISLWHFDNNTADAKNINNGIIKGTGFSKGIINYSLNLNNGEVEVKNSASLNLNNSFSVEFWIKANSSDENQMLLSKPGNFNLRIDGDGNLVFSVPNKTSINQSINFYSATIEIGNMKLAWEGKGSPGNTQFGHSVAVGDFNNDGYDDLVVGAPGNASTKGSVSVFLGNSNGLSPVPSWTAHSNEAYLYNQYGYSVASGDINNDGYDDIIVGSPAHYLPNGTAPPPGTVYVYLGGRDGISSSPEIITGLSNVDFGYSVASGDFNNDGYDDIIIGAPNDNSQNGKAYVYLGNANGINTSPVWTGLGEQTNSLYGYSVASGDVNNDSYDDIIVGSPGYSVTSDPKEGKTYVYLGNSAGASSSPIWTAGGQKTSCDSISYGCCTGCVDYPQAGYSVSTGDVNNDGYDDVIVGQPNHVMLLHGTEWWPASLVHVYLGNSNGVSSSHILMNWAWGDYGDNFGSSLATGDLNGDGYDDVLSGASNPAYTGLGAIAWLGNRTGTVFLGQGLVWYYTAYWQADTIGSIYSVASGDFNNDGYDDFVAGAPTFPDNHKGWNYVNYNDLGKVDVYLSKPYASIETPFPEDNGWHFVTATYNNQNGYLDLYVDGILKSSQFAGRNITINLFGSSDSISPLIIGDNRSNASIDELSVWSKPLTGQEITQDYDSKDIFIGSLPSVFSQKDTSDLYSTSITAAAESFWTASYQQENNCPQGYYFIAKSGNSSIKSNLLTVTNPSSSCIDNDHDGWNSTGGSCGLVDCNNNNAAIHPNAAEICNDGIDNNCNGFIDCQDSSCSGTNACKLNIFINSPVYTDYITKNIDFNISLSKPASSCKYTLDSWNSSYNMNKISDTKFDDFNQGLFGRAYLANFSCTDLQGSTSTNSVAFSINSTLNCIDNDGDGDYSNCGTPDEIDCDDNPANDPAVCSGTINCSQAAYCQCAKCIHPNATELCFSQDSDCTGGDYKKELVAYYPFDSDFKDYSGNNNDAGQQTLGTEGFVTGKLGGATRVYSYGYGGPGGGFYPMGLTVQYSESLDLNKEFTISLWVADKDSGLSGIPGYSDGFSFISKDKYYALGIINGNLYATIGNGTATSTVTNTSLIIPLHEWENIALVYMGNESMGNVGKISLYYNGKLNYTGTVNVSLMRGGSGIGIGNDIEGLVDEAKIWNYALNSSDIMQEFNRVNNSESYQAITNCQQLQDMNKNLNLSYYLANDIDCSGFNFIPVGNDSDYNTVGGIGRTYTGYPFEKNFDGRNHTIKNLRITRSNGGNTGLFGVTGLASVVKNLYIENLSYSGVALGQINFCGGISGANSGKLINVHTAGEITNCSYEGGIAGLNEGEITDSSSETRVSSNFFAGGFVGYNNGGIIKKSYSTGDVVSPNSNIGSNGDTGGFVGISLGYPIYAFNIGGYNIPYIFNCYSTGSVNSTVHNTGGFAGENYGIINQSYSTGNVNQLNANTYGDIGGFVGVNSGNAIILNQNPNALAPKNTITNCYSTGDVTIMQTIGYAGGFAGENWNAEIDNSYYAEKFNKTHATYAIGGFVGRNLSSNCSNNFFNKDISAFTSDSCAAGKTTAEMKQQSTFTGWDFNNVWGMQDYPYLLFNEQNITPSVCGNNITEQGEQCDGTSLAGKSCPDFGFSSGNLSCLQDCTGFNSSRCTNASIIIAPYVAFVSPKSQTYNTTTITINITNSSNAVYVWWFNGTKNNTYSSPINLTLANGNYNFIAYANNSAGTVNSSSVAFTVSYTPADTTYPIFSNYQDNNGTLQGSGTALFNVTVAGTNGSIYLNINNQRIPASNVSDKYSASVTLANGTYIYNWTAYGNGTSHNANTSVNRYYTVKSPACINNDNDKDGWNATASCNSNNVSDCDDSDTGRFPGNPEICDNKDNNCDNLIDNGIAPQSCGTGVCAGNQTCSSGIWGSCSSNNRDSGICAKCNNGAIVYDSTQNSDCSDNNVCNGNESCKAIGQCNMGVALSCNDNVACTEDVCNPLSGCQYSENNTKCLDTFSCTNDVCNVLSGCQNIKDDSKCAPGERCIAYNHVSCAAQVTNCSGVQDGVSCDDGLANCTIGRTCLNQTCQGGQPKDCSSFNLPGINGCNDSSDNNQFTKDFRQQFTSSCQESSGNCNQGNSSITHACDFSCGAKCTNNSNVLCPGDVCAGNDFQNYPVNGVCNQQCINDTSNCIATLEVDSLQCKAIVNYTIAINSGVNFVSIPLLLLNYSIDNVTSGNSNKIDKIYAYDGSWKAYYTNNPSFSSLREFNAGQGYVLFANQSFNLVLYGYTKTGSSAPYSRPSFTLKQGWNLLGVMNNKTVSQALTGVSYSSVYKYNSGNYALLGSSEVLEKGKGYWVYMNSAGSIISLEKEGLESGD